MASTPELKATSSVVPPMSFGELLDRMFSLYRHHLWLFVGIMAIPALVSMSMTFLLPSSQQPFTPDNSTTEPLAQAGAAGILFAAIGVISVVYWIMYAVALGATSFALSEILLGRTATVRSSYQQMRGKFWRLMDLLFSVLLRGFGLLFLIMMAVVLSMSALIELLSFKMGGIVAALLGFAAAAAGFGVTIWYLLGFGVAVPALVLEDLKAGAAMKRSVFLTRGQRAKVFLILVLTMIITYVAALVFQGPFWLASALVAERGESVLLFSYLTGIAGAVGAAFVGPLMMLGLALLYFDLRIRREGFDLQMMLSQLQNAPVSAEAPGPPSPSSQD